MSQKILSTSTGQQEVSASKSCAHRTGHSDRSLSRDAEGIQILPIHPLQSVPTAQVTGEGADIY